MTLGLTPQRSTGPYAESVMLTPEGAKTETLFPVTRISTWRLRRSRPALNSSAAGSTTVAAVAASLSLEALSRSRCSARERFLASSVARNSSTQSISPIMTELARMRGSSQRLSSGASALVPPLGFRFFKRGGCDCRYRAQPPNVGSVDELQFASHGPVGDLG